VADSRLGERGAEQVMSPALAGAARASAVEWSPQPEEVVTESRGQQVPASFLHSMKHELIERLSWYASRRTK